MPELWRRLAARLDDRSGARQEWVDARPAQERCALGRFGCPCTGAPGANSSGGSRVPGPLLIDRLLVSERAVARGARGSVE